MNETEYMCLAKESRCFRGVMAPPRRGRKQSWIGDVGIELRAVSFGLHFPNDTSAGHCQEASSATYKGRCSWRQSPLEKPNTFRRLLGEDRDGLWKAAQSKACLSWHARAPPASGYPPSALISCQFPAPMSYIHE